MRFEWILCVCLAIGSLPNDADATTLTYEYVGAPLFNEAGAPYFRDRHRMTLKIDETIYPDRIAGDELSFSFLGAAWTDLGLRPEWLVEFSSNIFNVPTQAYGYALFKFDEDNNVLDFIVDFADDPPDGISTPKGDFFCSPCEPSENWASQGPGRWSSPASVPVPAALPLLAAAVIASSAALGRRSKPGR